jgi:peptidoglycan hydrolase CwlO-like protein
MSNTPPRKPGLFARLETAEARNAELALELAAKEQELARANAALVTNHRTLTQYKEREKARADDAAKTAAAAAVPAPSEQLSGRARAAAAFTRQVSGVPR